MKQAKTLNLVLYSGGQSKSNHRLHAEVARLARARRRGSRAGSTPLSMTYIPFETEGSATYFARAIRRYRAAGIERFFLLEPEIRPSRAELEILLSSDVIYLAGGNTYTFLASLRKSGLLGHLRRYALAGGVLAGLSAGAILMTPSIALAGIPRFDADENEAGVRDLDALALVDFEFSPHDTHHSKRSTELLRYSKRSPRTIFSVADGGGLVVSGGEITLLGRAKAYHRGRCWRVSPLTSPSGALA